MKRYLFLILLAVSCSVSCRKAKEGAPAAGTSASTIRVRLAGDIITAEHPLPGGRWAGNTSGNARELRDSTLYAVMVYDQSQYYTIARGLFNKPDSIVLHLPVSGQYRIVVTAVKRGTGPGLYYEWIDGEQYFRSPFHSTIGNKMDTSAWHPMTDSVHFITFDPLDSTRYSFADLNEEVDAYQGETVINAASLPPSITINLKRLSYGLRFSATGFTSGKLIVQHYWSSWWTKTLTPENIASKDFIHSYDFRDVDIVQAPIRISWIKADGDTLVLNEKPVTFKRNVLTHIHITIPETGRISSGNAVLSYSEEPLR